MVERYLNIGFTGTQLGMTEEQKSIFSKVLRGLVNREGRTGPVWFHHGDCIGADAQAHEIARNQGHMIYLHPPTDEKKRAFCSPVDYIARPFDYLTRNAYIVADSDFMFATPHETTERRRSGTWWTILSSRMNAKPLCIIYHDGTIALERWQ